MDKQYDAFLKGIDTLTRHDAQHKNLDTNLVCFQAVHDKSSKAPYPIFSPIDYSSDERLHESLRNTLRALKSLNNEGYGIYWAVNEFGQDMTVGGISHENSEKWQMLADYVTRIRSFFVDVDCYLEPDELQELIDSFEPTLVIVTSTQDEKYKAHFYWQLDNSSDIALVDDFSEYQELLA